MYSIMKTELVTESSDSNRPTGYLSGITMQAERQASVLVGIAFQQRINRSVVTSSNMSYPLA